MIIMEPSSSIRLEYNQVPVVVNSQVDYIIDKQEEYGSPAFSDVVKAFSSDIVDFCVAAGTLFKTIGEQMKIPDDLADVWQEMLQMDVFSPDVTDDIRRINRICNMYRSTCIVGGNKAIDRAATDVRKFMIVIIQISNERTVQSFLNKTGVSDMLSENPSLHEQQATDAIWVLSQFVRFCVRFVQMVTI